MDERDCELALSCEAAADPITGAGIGSPDGWRASRSAEERVYAGPPSSPFPRLMVPPREFGVPFDRTKGSITRAVELLGMLLSRNRAVKKSRNRSLCETLVSSQNSSDEGLRFAVSPKMFGDTLGSWSAKSSVVSLVWTPPPSGE